MVPEASKKGVCLGTPTAFIIRSEVGVLIILRGR